MLCLCVLTLQSCATTSVSESSGSAAEPTEQASVFLNHDEVNAYVSGSTETWSKGAGYYASDGQLQVVWDGELLSGAWQVRDTGEVCFTVAAWGNEEDCHRYQRQNGIVKLFYEDKARQRDIVEGNQLEQFL